MNKPLEVFDLRGDELNYDVTLDKNRQIGATSLLVTQVLQPYRDTLTTPEDCQAMDVILEEFRHFIVGNTTASSIKFDSAYTYFQFHLMHRSPVAVQELVHTIARVISLIKCGFDYADELMTTLESLNLYKREDALLVLNSDYTLEVEG